MPATPISRIDGMTTSVAVKPPCITATNAAITLSGEQQVGGVPVVEGDRVLVKNQTDTTTNGIYIVSTGDWTRAPDFDGARDAVYGTLVIVVSTTGANILYRVTCTDDPIVFGTSHITFAVLTNSSGILNITDFGVSGGGTGDQGGAINAAILAVSATGGGGLYFPPGNYTHSTAIIQQSNVVLWGFEGVTLTWTGGSAAQITSPTTGCLLRAGIVGINLNSGAASKSIETFSGWHCNYVGIEAATNSATSIVMDFLCNSTGTLNADSNYNSVFNYVENLLQTGTCGTFIRLKGIQATPVGEVVTLNTFNGCNAQGCKVRGIDFAGWADSNKFVGLTRVALTASNAVGVEWNSSIPASNTGVYANDFDRLAVDTFVIGGVTGRVGFKMNNTKENKIDKFFNDPVAEGGMYILDALCLSYDFVVAVDEDVMGEGKTNAIYHRTNASRMSEGTYSMDIGTRGTGDLRLFAGATMQARMRHDVVAVNWLDFFGSVASGTNKIICEGASTNVTLLIASKGTGSVTLATNQNVGGANIGLDIIHVVAGVNYVQLQQNTAGNAPVLRSAGADTNINFALQSKGTGSLLLGTNSTTNQVIITHTASATNTINMTGSNGGNPTISVSGGSLNVGSTVVFTNQTVGTAVGAAGGATALPATPLGYFTTSINGTACKIPYYN